MKRGDLYRVYKGSQNDPKKYRVFVIVSRKVLIESNFSSVICAPVYTKFDGLTTQVKIGIEEGLKHESSINEQTKTITTHFSYKGRYGVYGIPDTAFTIIKETGELLSECILLNIVPGKYKETDEYITDDDENEKITETNKSLKADEVYVN